MGGQKWDGSLARAREHDRAPHSCLEAVPMTPWTLVDRAEAEDGARLELFRRGSHYSIRVNGSLLMNSRVHDSERALAQLALEALAPEPRAAARVLVGGLGFGYTLAAALGVLGPGAAVSVVEIAGAVIRWNRDLLGELNGQAVADPRVTLIEADLCAFLRAPPQPFDVLLLDVDNGPRAVGRPANSWLYSPEGLAALRAALHPGGVLAVWSAGPEVGFSDRLRSAGFDVVLHRVQSHAVRTRERHFIWLATRPRDAA
jgi:spermidine synthase